MLFFFLTSWLLSTLMRWWRGSAADWPSSERGGASGTFLPLGSVLLWLRFCLLAHQSPAGARDRVVGVYCPGFSIVLWGGGVSHCQLCRNTVTVCTYVLACTLGVSEAPLLLAFLSFQENFQENEIIDSLTKFGVINLLRISHVCKFAHSVNQLDMLLR